MEIACATTGLSVVLVRLLCDGSPRVSCNAARTVKNVATDLCFCELLVGEGVVEALVRILSPDSCTELREQAARALGNIATHESNEQLIVDEKGVQALISLLEVDSHGIPSTVDAALGALGNLIDSQQMRETFVETQGVEKLTPLVHDWMALMAADKAGTRIEGADEPPAEKLFKQVCALPRFLPRTACSRALRAARRRAGSSSRSPSTRP